MTALVGESPVTEKEPKLPHLLQVIGIGKEKVERNKSNHFKKMAEQV